MAQKKIAILVISLAGGGGEREASILANHYCKDHDTTVVLLNDTIVYELDERVKVKMLANKPLQKRSVRSVMSIPILAIRFMRFCRQEEVDIVISFLNRTNLIAAMSRIFGNTSKLFLCQVTTLNRAYARNTFGDKMMKRLSKWLYPKADAVISNSKGSSEEMSRDYGVENSYTIYNPVDLEMVRKKSEEAVPNPPDPSKFSFIMVARFTYPKDFTSLLTAFSLFETDDVELILLGDGQDREATEAFAEDLGISDRVHFLGFSSNPFAYLAKSDCFVFSSLYEGFPNGMQEALACGLPVVSSDCHFGPREMLLDDFRDYSDIFGDKNYYIGDSGILVPLVSPEKLYEAMKLIKEDKSLYQKLKSRASTKANEYAVDKIAKEFETITG